MARMSPLRTPYCNHGCSAHNFEAGDYMHAHLNNSGPDRYTLCTGSNWVRCVLDIGALDNRAVGQEESAADAEFGVGACW